jgi:hypothetical protein
VPTNCAQAIVALIYPFKWPYIYIPLLPLPLAGALAASRTRKRFGVRRVLT